MANSAVVGMLKVLLSANTAEFEAGMKRSAESMRAFTKDFRVIGQQATALGSAMTKVFTIPLLGLGVAAAKAATDFESSFAGVRKTVDATEAEFKQMAQAFRNLAKEIPINVNELNRLGEAAGALGIPKDQIVEFARVMALLGETTDLTSDQAAESIAKIQAIFGAAGKDTDRFAATLVALGNDGASTESQILAMATRIAGAGNTIGLTQGQVLGFASALSSVGLEAEAGGTAISRVFVDIASAVSKGGESLQEFATVAGLSQEAFAQLFKEDAAQAVLRFVEGLQKVKKSGGDLLGTLEELGFTEIRVRDTLLRAAGAGDLLRKSLDLQGKAWRENSALTAEANKRFETTEAQIRLLWNRVKDLGITIGNALLPMIKATVDTLGALLPVAEAIAKVFTAMPVSMQVLAVGLGLAVAAAGPLLYAFGQLALAGAALTQTFTRNGIAARALGLSHDATTASTVALTNASRTLGTTLLGMPWAVAAAGIGIFAAAVITTKEHLNSLRDAAVEAARAQTARGVTGNAAVTQGLAEKERQLTEAIRDGNRVLISRLSHEIEAIKTDQTRLAMLDVINRAIANGAKATITYTEAVEFNAKALQASAAAGTAATQATEQSIDPTKRLQEAKAALAEAEKKYQQELTGIKEALALQIKNMDKTGATVKSLAAEYKISEHTVSRFKAELEQTGKAAEKASSWIEDFRTSAKRLETQLRLAAKAGVPMTVVLEEFGSQIEHVVNRAPLLGDAIGEIGEATKRAGEALRQGELDKAVAKLLEDANNEARKFAGEMQKAGEEAGKRFAEGLAKSNKELSAVFSNQQQRLLTLDQDSLEKRLALVKVEFDRKRAALDSHSTFYAEELALVNAEEAAAARQATEEWQQHISDVQQAVGGYGQIFADALRGIPNLIQQGLTGGGGFQGAGQALLSGLGGAIGGRAFGSLAAGLSNTLFSTFGVAITSALGVIIPGIGAAIGAMLGPLVGWLADKFRDETWEKVMRDVGRDWGIEISEGLARQIADTADEIGSRADAPLHHLAALFAEAGGVAEYGLDRAIRKTRDLFSAIDRGTMTGEQAVEQLNAVFPELAAEMQRTGSVASAEFLELIKLTNDFGLEVEQVTQFLSQQGQRFASGFTTAIKPLEKTFAELTKDWDFERLTTRQKASLQSVVPELERFGRLAVAAFNAAKASGLSDLEAFDAIGGSLDALVPMYERLNQAGITAGSVALQELLNKRALINANRELIEAAGGLNEMALALSYLNGLNVDTLKDLEAQGLQTFDKLVAAGFSERDALEQIVPFLETIIKSHKELGVPIDENTQKLIDQAEANGLLKDEALSMNDILMEGFIALIEAVGGDLPEAFKKFKTEGMDAAKGVKTAIDDIPKEVNVDVNIPKEVTVAINYEEGPRPSLSTAARGGFVGRSRVLPFTLGGLVPAQHYDLGGAVGRLVRFSPRGSDTVPAMLTPGEGVVSVRGMEVLGREGLAALNRGMVPGQTLDPHGNASISNNVVILPVIRDAEIDVDTIMDVVGAYLPDDVRRNSRNHIATRLKAALELAG